MELMTKIAQAFDHGGIWMWPILGMQIVSLAIAAERFYALMFRRKVNQSELAQTFEEPIRRGEIQNADG